MESLFSSNWYRVAELKPRLRGHAKIHRHDYRDEVWYVLQDHLSGKFHRFSDGANQVIGLMDGRRTVDQIWQRAAEVLGDDSPTQDEMIRLLSQLHSADLLQSEINPDSEELFRRFRRHRRTRRLQRFSSPLALRFTLFDPERFLSRYLWMVRPLFSVFGFALWLAVIAYAAVSVVMHWPELTHDVVDRVLAPQNLFLLWLVYPFVKALHELGHAFATKVWGGEVHEIGIMLLVFMPVPYVDASAASAFRERHRRLIVGAMGIMVELFLAAIALFVWLNAEYGVVRAIAYNVMLIGGFSTLFFNGNPLLRFDGYYVLADAIELPNLAKRSNDYLGYVAQRYLFGVREAESPARTRSERRWFVFYGIASFAYRMFIAVVIIMLVAGQFFVVGVLLAVWAAVMMLGLPLAKGIKFLLSSPRLREQRPRALAVSGTLLAVLAGALFLVPAPHRTLVEGVVWLPDDAIVRAGTDCVIRGYRAEPDSFVATGAALVACEDPLLRASEEVSLARLRELGALYDAQWRDDRVAANITSEEIKAVEGDLEVTRDRLEALTIRSPASGRFVVPEAPDQPGRFVRQGDVLGYVVEDLPMKVRVAVPEDDAELVRAETRDVLVQLVGRIGESIDAVVVRQVPGGRHKLPSAVLGTEGGGMIEVDLREAGNTKTFSPVFEYDLELDPTVPRAPTGTRAYVRFDHGTRPLGLQWYRKARQVFLSHFGV